MIEERGGWFVMNVGEAQWYASPRFGKMASFEDRKAPFPQTGVHLFVLEPGHPNCFYHRENAQEDFLVLSGECRLLVNGEERLLKTWDFVHCPPNVSHVFIGAGDGPCHILAIGHRPADHQLYYPESGPARAHGAEVSEPTADPQAAYSTVPSWEKTESDWHP